MPQFQVLQRSPGFGEMLGQALGSGLSQGIGESLSQHFQRKQMQTREQDLISRGMHPAIAKLAAAAPVGGQTEAFKVAFDAMQRQPGGLFESLGMEQPQMSQEVAEQAFPSADVGLTPKERAKRESERFGKQAEKYEGLSERLQSVENEGMKINRLSEINETEDLPSGLGRINVDIKSGELKLPFAASPESQEFVKIVNDFLSGAKDSFGARVTNFEVDRFMKRLPSLLNTQEGRRRILRQMNIINQINQLETSGIIDEFDKRGGVRKIDLDVATRNARKMHKKEIDRLRSDYVQGEKELSSMGKKSEGAVKMRDPSGNLRSVPRDKVKEAASAGYKVEK